MSIQSILNLDFYRKMPKFFEIYIAAKNGYERGNLEAIVNKLSARNIAFDDMTNKQKLKFEQDIIDYIRS